MCLGLKVMLGHMYWVGQLYFSFTCSIPDGRPCGGLGGWLGLAVNKTISAQAGAGIRAELGSMALVVPPLMWCPRQLPTLPYP